MGTIDKALDPLPDHWYFFFGILEPVSVLAGAYYALALPEKYNHKLVPPAFLSSSKVQHGLLKAGVLTDATRMALGQLGSCYFLIMLNSALMFYALRKFLRGRHDKTLERLVRYLIFVLAAADWTHIGITVWLLPNGPRGFRSATFMDKLSLLAKPESWNSLLFGNIMITFILFCFRVLWWNGIARGSPIRHLAAAKGGKKA